MESVGQQVIGISKVCRGSKSAALRYFKSSLKQTEPLPERTSGLWRNIKQRERRGWTPSRRYVAVSGSGLGSSPKSTLAATGLRKPVCGPAGPQGQMPIAAQACPLARLDEARTTPPPSTRHNAGRSPRCRNPWQPAGEHIEASRNTGEPPAEDAKGRIQTGREDVICWLSRREKRQAREGGRPPLPFREVLRSSTAL